MTVGAYGRHSGTVALADPRKLVGDWLTVSEAEFKYAALHFAAEHFGHSAAAIERKWRYTGYTLALFVVELALLVGWALSLAARRALRVELDARVRGQRFREAWQRQLRLGGLLRGRMVGRREPLGHAAPVPGCNPVEALGSFCIDTRLYAHGEEANTLAVIASVSVTAPAFAKLLNEDLSLADWRLEFAGVACALALMVGFIARQAGTVHLAHPKKLAAQDWLLSPPAQFKYEALCNAAEHMEHNTVSIERKWKCTWVAFGLFCVELVLFFLWATAA